MEEAVSLFPRSAFLMIHDNNRVSAIEAQMQAIAREELEAAKFQSKAASDIRRAGDYLSKIIRMVRGCGFGIAIFSDATPPRTLANIFFEVGYCLALGKPTFLVLAGEHAAPSDFVRSEWIAFTPDDEPGFRKSIQGALAEMNEYGHFLEKLALSAEDAEEVNPELAYERFKRAFLVSGREEARDGIRRVHTRIRTAKADTDIGLLMRSYRRKLSDEIGHFLKIGDQTG
jgi:nucleoside 2-deoxyribosyltransferase